MKNSRFRGRRVEGNGLSNFGARYYNTETGSFLSADPYGHDGSLDLYSYASADPVNYVDPDGRLSQPVNQPLGGEAPQESFYQKASAYVNSKLDHIQTGLDVIGMTPGIGNIADIANAAISGSRGDWSGMAMNMAAAMPVVGIGVTAGKLGVKAGTEIVGATAPLFERQASNLSRFEKKLPAQNLGTFIRELPNRGKAFWSEVPGKVPGSKAIYEKQVDALGNTIQYTKTTYGPTGEIIHVKDKIKGIQLP